MIIALGSTSEHKMKAVASACEQLGLKAMLLTCKAPSGVNEQPFGLDETFQGALNRARFAQAIHGKLQRPISIGIENGVVELGSKTSCESKYVDLAIVVIIDAHGREFVSTSVGINFPEHFVKTAEARGFSSTTTGNIIAEMMGGDATDPHSTLTRSRVKRVDLLKDAIVAALARADIP